ncbi:MAG: Zn-ribbon domain-containing OB-fold protein [Acidimicrobiia bacterium]|nr:Zn-ribbon domain-containing OB-fold protein [Acidimicrobiia bacterium]
MTATTYGSAPIAPDPTPTSQPFWDALAAGRVEIQHCADCGAWVYYPRSRCSSCLSANLVWEQVSGEGTLYTFTVARQPTTPAFADAGEMVIGVVVLDEGVKVTTALENVKPADVRVGMRVRPVFVPTASGLVLLRHEPA